MSAGMTLGFSRNPKTKTKIKHEIAMGHTKRVQDKLSNVMTKKVSSFFLVYSCITTMHCKFSNYFGQTNNISIFIPKTFKHAWVSLKWYNYTCNSLYHQNNPMSKALYSYIQFYGMWNNIFKLSKHFIT